MSDNDDPDLRTVVREDPEAAWSVATRSDDELQEWLLQYVKEERPEWYAENVDE